jgi:hypothetical protein
MNCSLQDEVKKERSADERHDYADRKFGWSNSRAGKNVGYQCKDGA